MTTNKDRIRELERVVKILRDTVKSQDRSIRRLEGKNLYLKDYDSGDKVLVDVTSNQRPFREWVEAEVLQKTPEDPCHKIEVLIKCRGFFRSSCERKWVSRSNIKPRKGGLR